MRAGTKGWIGLGGYVLVWNLCCPDGETLSEAADDWNPALATVLIYAVAHHVANRIDERIDVIHLAHLGIRAARRKLLA